MRKRYHVLRTFIVILKVMAFVTPIDILYRWYQARTYLLESTAQLNQLTDQMNQAYDQLSRVSGLATSLGIPFVVPTRIPTSGISFDLTEQDINRVISAILVAIALWALSEYLSAHLAIEENTRGALSLLWRLVRHEMPGEEREYMKSLHGVWDDAPPARVPNEHWKRTSMTVKVDPAEAIKKHKDYLRPSSETATPEPNYRAFRNQKGSGDPPSW